MASSRDLLSSSGSAKIGAKEDVEEVPIDVQKASWSHKIEVFRLKTKKFLTANIAGILYQESLLYLSVFSTGQFVFSTYEGASDLLDSIEVALAVVFGFDWALSLFTADHKIEFVTRLALDSLFNCFGEALLYLYPNLLCCFNVM